jgi:hypothetical protein
MKMPPPILLGNVRKKGGRLMRDIDGVERAFVVTAFLGFLVLVAGFIALEVL